MAAWPLSTAAWPWGEKWVWNPRADGNSRRKQSEGGGGGQLKIRALWASLAVLNGNFDYQPFQSGSFQSARTQRKINIPKCLLGQRIHGTDGGEPLFLSTQLVHQLFLLARKWKSVGIIKRVRQFHLQLDRTICNRSCVFQRRLQGARRPREPHCAITMRWGGGECKTKHSQNRTVVSYFPKQALQLDWKPNISQRLKVHGAPSCTLEGGWGGGSGDPICCAWAPPRFRAVLHREQIAPFVSEKPFFIIWFYLATREAGSPCSHAALPRVSRQPSIGKHAHVAPGAQKNPSGCGEHATRRRSAKTRGVVGEEEGAAGGICQVCTVLLSFFPPQPVTLFSVAWSRVQAAAPQRDIQSGTQRGNRQRGPNDEETRFVAGSNTSLPPERRRPSAECRRDSGGRPWSANPVAVCSAAWFVAVVLSREGSSFGPLNLFITIIIFPGDGLKTII